MIDLTKQYFLLLFDVKNSSGLKNEEFNKRMKLIRQKLDESNAVNSTPAYYLLGTFINFGLAIVFVLIGKEVLKLITC